MVRFRSRASAMPYALTAAAMLTLTSCSSSQPDQQSDNPADPEITVGWDGDLGSYNEQTLAGTSGQGLLAGVQTSFWRFDSEGNLVPQSTFGTATKISDKPLTVRYTINPHAVWSDGRPIDCDDVVLAWAAHSRQILSAGRPVFSGTTPAVYRAARAPMCTKGSRQATVVFNHTTPDWRALFGPGEPLLPAHVVERASGLSEAALIKAARDRDSGVLGPAARFWNAPRWGATAPGRLNPSTMLSSGPYLLDQWSPNQTLTLRANPRWWGPKPRTGRITFRYVDSGEMPQALVNGEVDVVAPPARIAIVSSLKLQGSDTNLQRFGTFSYERLWYDPTGSLKDPVLRRAFTTCLPRDTIVEDLVNPTDADAHAMNARLTMPYRDTYAEAVSQTAARNYIRSDPKTALSLLQSRKAVGRVVRLGYDASDVRRASVAGEIRDACVKAGFKVQVMASEGLGDRLSGNGFDAVLTGGSTSSLPAQAAAGVSAPSRRVRSLITRLGTQTDTGEADRTIAEIEKQLWLDLSDVPLFANARIAAWRGVHGVNPTVGDSGITWNLAEWERD